MSEKDRLCQELKNLKKLLKTWRAVADHFGVNPGIVWLIVNDENYIPTRPDIREALGLLPTTTIKAAPGLNLDGTYIPWNAKVIKCANPECNIMFVRLHPSQKYHDKKCRK